MHKRWNISILVIFVLLASSLLGILSMNFVQQMMKQSAVVHSYYKSYYLAKAGLEFGLTAISVRGIGFEYTIASWSALVRDNFFSGARYSLSLAISGTSSVLSKNPRQGSGCDHPYLLSGWQSVIVPLFKDAYTGDAEGIFTTPITTQNLADALKQDKIVFTPRGEGKMTFGLLLLTWDELHENGTYSHVGNRNEGLTPFIKSFETYYGQLDPTIANRYANVDFPYTIYLMITNTDTSEQSLCLETAPYVLPTDTFFLASQAAYGNQQVALDASYAQPIPGFLFGTYSSY